MTVTFEDRLKRRLAELSSSALVDRALVVDTLLDLYNDASRPEERRRLEVALVQIPRSVVVDRLLVADVFLDLLGDEEPSPN